MLDAIVTAFQGGGFFMWFILATLLWALIIFAERFYVLFIEVREDKNALLGGLNNYIMKGDLHGAIRFLSAQRPGPMARILKAGLLKVHRSDLEVQATLDQASLHEVPHLETRTGYLAVLSNAATLVGLLGTITGMIKCFAGVASADPANKASQLAFGISEAMNCTAFGLIVAIPSLLAFGFLQSRTQHLIDGINEGVVTEMNLVLGNRALFRDAAKQLGESGDAALR